MSAQRELLENRIRARIERLNRREFGDGGEIELLREIADVAWALHCLPTLAINHRAPFALQLSVGCCDCNATHRPGDEECVPVGGDVDTALAAVRSRAEGDGWTHGADGWTCKTCADRAAREPLAPDPEDA